MKNWIKYIAVVCCFLIMAGIFVPDSGTKVKASESGSEQGIEEQTEEPTEEQIEEQTEEQIEEQIEEQTEEQIEEQTEEQIEDQTEEQIEEQTEEQTEEQIEEQSTMGTLTVHWNSEGNSWGNSITVSGVQTDSGSNLTYTIDFPTEKPTKEGHTFAGWKCNDSSINTDVYQSASGTLACSSDITEITFEAQWTPVSSGGDETKTPTNGEVSSGSGKYYFEGLSTYTLGRGTWTVEGDSSIYPGGITFYVGSGGTYYVFEWKN